MFHGGRDDRLSSVEVVKGTRPLKKITSPSSFTVQGGEPSLTPFSLSTAEHCYVCQLRVFYGKWGMNVGSPDIGAVKGKIAQSDQRRKSSEVDIELHFLSLGSMSKLEWELNILLLLSEVLWDRLVALSFSPRS